MFSHWWSLRPQKSTNSSPGRIFLSSGFRESFEIPLAVKLVAMQRKCDVIVALGVVLQGETAHAELIARSVTEALMRLALEFSVPVIHEVLFLKNEEQAKARCLGPKLNRGLEAARAAVAMARTVKQLSSN